jgi:hypothetical protein
MLPNPIPHETGCLCHAVAMAGLPAGAAAWRVTLWSMGAAYRLSSPVVTRDGLPPAYAELGRLFLDRRDLFQSLTHHV